MMIDRWEEEDAEFSVDMVKLDESSDHRPIDEFMIGGDESPTLYCVFFTSWQTHQHIMVSVDAKSVWRPAVE